jgi:hypothetical protein
MSRESTLRLLSDVEKAAAAGDVRELIISSGQTATLLRKQAGESLYGSDEGAFVEVCTFVLEISETPPKDLAKQIDAAASVLPDLDVRVEDRVLYGGCCYRVQTVATQSLFGIPTYKVLELVRLHGD